MEYHKKLDHAQGESLFKAIHSIPWEVESQVDSDFYLTKIASMFDELDFDAEFDLIYFDAFGPRVQPHLWTEKIFRIMFKALRKGGLLTTYSSKGDARRAMIAAGFRVEKHPGPPGKREMLIAFKDE